MKGNAGLRLLDHAVDALADHLPSSVRAIRSRAGAVGGLQIWAVPSTVSADEEYGFWDTGDREQPGFEQRGIWLPWGFGSWLPLPRRVRMRAEAVDALESILEAVRKLDPSWPAPDAVVKTRLEDDGVLAWFHSPTAASLVPPPVRLPQTLFD